MDPSSREICLCFHVTQRKIENFLRVEKPKRVGQLSDCFGAGTGCGWCRPFLQKLFEAAVEAGKTTAELPTAEEYAEQRTRYIQAGKIRAGETPAFGDNDKIS